MLRGRGSEKKGFHFVAAWVVAKWGKSDNGVACRQKERTYPELVGEGRRERLVVLAAEVGGQWSENCTVSACSESSPFFLQNRVKVAYIRRWTGIQVCFREFALTLVTPPHFIHLQKEKSRGLARVGCGCGSAAACSPCTNEPAPLRFSFASLVSSWTDSLDSTNRICSQMAFLAAVPTNNVLAWIRTLVLMLTFFL